MKIVVKALPPQNENRGYGPAEGNTKLKFSRAEFVKTLCIATSQTNCLFNGKVFDQIDGVAMGSPLAPFLAKLFVGHHENLWMKNYQGPAVLSIDDMLMIHSVFSTLRMRQNYFLTFLTHNIQISNSLWKNNKILAFLHVCIDNNDPSCLKTSIYKEKTFTGLLTNFFSLFPSFTMLGSSVL